MVTRINKVITKYEIIFIKFSDNLWLKEKVWKLDWVKYWYFSGALINAESLMHLFIDYEITIK